MTITRAMINDPSVPYPSCITVILRTFSHSKHDMIPVALDTQRPYLESLNRPALDDMHKQSGQLNSFSLQVNVTIACKAQKATVGRYTAVYARYGHIGMVYLLVDCLQGMLPDRCNHPRQRPCP